MLLNPIKVDKISASRILRAFCGEGIILSGGFALQFFLPASFTKRQEDDIDFIFSYKGALSDVLRILNKIGKRAGLTHFEELKQHSKQQPRRTIFEATSPEKNPIVVHVEVTDLKIPARMERLRAKGLTEKVPVLLPDVNYLVARLIFGASSPTRPWHRRLDDLAYLCHLTHFQKSAISKQKVFRYLRKLCGGQSALKQRRINLQEVLNLASPEELITRTARVRTRAPFDYKGAMERVSRTFGQSGRADPKILISRKIYLLPPHEKKK